jgi:hypothetical protein
MNQSENRPIVLARFPRIHRFSHSGRSAETLTSRGRWLNQSMSFKLLATAVVLLVVIALVPFVRGTSKKVAESPASEAPPAVVWQPAEPAAPIETQQTKVAKTTPTDSETLFSTPWPSSERSIPGDSDAVEHSSVSTDNPALANRSSTEPRPL